MEKVSITVDLPVEVHAKVREAADREFLSMKRWVLQRVLDRLHKEEENALHTTG